MKKEKKNKGKKKRTGLKIFLVLLLIIGIAGGVFAYKVSRNGGGMQGIIATTLGHDEETKKNLPVLTFLATGQSQNLTDTIILCTYNPQTGQASMLSIPRDTFIGSSPSRANTFDKINALYQSSPEELLEAVSELTGLEVTNYVNIDTKALRELVDTIGGVNFDVPIDMDYDDAGQKLHIHLKAGYQKLNGEQAEGVVRFRHNNDGSTYPEEYGMEDLGRMKTQRAFIAATLKQTLQANNVLKLGEFLEIANENVETNMDVNVIKDYIPYAVSVDIESIRTETLPGEPKYYNGLSFYVVDEEETEALVQEMFLGISETEEGTEGESATQLKIEVLNGSGDSDKLSEVTELLNNSGYNVTKTGEVTSTGRTTIINRTNISEERANGLKETLGLGNMTVGENNSNVDFTIIIGRDY